MFAGHNAEVGTMLSSTVTTPLHVLVFPLLSVAVKITVLPPTVVQSNVFGSTDKEVIPQISELPLSISVASIVAFPDASN